MCSHYFQRHRVGLPQRWLYRLIIFVLLLAEFTPQRQAQSQQEATPTPAPTATPAAATPTLAELEETELDAQVEAILAAMSPADKVGQLFVITFAGNDTTANSDLAELIHTYRIGGVVLSPRYRNFSNAKGTDTPREVATLTNQLQGLAYGVHLPTDQVFAPLPDPEDSWPSSPLTALTETNPAPVYLPLFIAVEQAGDDLPQTALRNGFTPLPSQMALGATWNPDLVRQVGVIVGSELHAVGVNLLLGPNLDVIDNPRADIIGGLGIRSFGGDPYWVGRLGQEYITGVHQGGRGFVATMARHFPGQGDVDRLPDQEVATVQKSLEDLQRVSLAPFRAVVQDSSLILRSDGDPGATDGIMTSHMRYSNLPGSSTPISVGPDLLKVLEQEGFADWHNRGGLLMSNAIGVRALRRYYDSTEQAFPRRRAASEIFNAGHDLIYLDGLSQPRAETGGEPSWPEAKAAIINIVTLFQEQYVAESAPGFARRVDESVRRILRLKLRLYGRGLPPLQPAADPVITNTQPATATASITATLALTMPMIPLSQILTPATALQVLAENLDQSRAVVGLVASDAVAVLKPNVQTLAEALPAPQAEETMLIFSDSRLLYECKPGCTAETALGPEAIADIINQLYGTEIIGQMPKEQVTSKTIGELEQWLGPPRSAAEVPLATGVTTPTVAAVTTLITDTTGIAATVEGVDKASVQEQATLVASSALTQEIATADWIVFAMLDIDEEHPTAVEVVKRFLGNENSAQLKDKKIVVLALNAPYFLDATELSRVTAYFGVFSKTAPFVESAVRALFRTYGPTGAPPVNVPGTDFANLADRLKLDINRPLQLQVFVGNSNVPLQFNGENSPQAQVGDMLRLFSGPLLDLNGKPVPDGIPINFILSYEGDIGGPTIEPGTTRDGQVIREIILDRAGILQVTADAGVVQSDGPASLLVQDPNQPAPNPTVAPSANVTGTQTISGTTATAADSPGITDPTATTARRLVDLITLAVALLTILITLSLLVIAQVQILPRQTLVHNMLWATIFGLGAYILYGFGWLPGSSMLQERLDAFGPAFVVFIAMLLPLVWLQLRTEQGQ